AGRRSMTETSGGGGSDGCALPLQPERTVETAQSASAKRVACPSPITMRCPSEHLTFEHHIRTLTTVLRKAQRAGPAASSVDDGEKRLSFFDDIRGELRAFAAADVLCCVDRSSRDEQNVAGFERHRRLSLDVVLQRTLKDVDDLFAGVCMPGRHNAGLEFDP